MFVSLLLVAVPAGLVLVIGVLLGVFDVKRDHDGWTDRDEATLHGRITTVEPKVPTPTRTAGFGARHRWSLAERTRFWSLHRHANSRF